MCNPNSDYSATFQEICEAKSVATVEDKLLCSARF